MKFSKIKCRRKFVFGNKNDFIETCKKGDIDSVKSFLQGGEILNESKYKSEWYKLTNE